MSDDYEHFTPEQDAAERNRREAATAKLLSDIKEACERLQSIFWAARDGGDGSFGLKLASQRLHEAEMWANKEIRGSHGVEWP